MLFFTSKPHWREYATEAGLSVASVEQGANYFNNYKGANLQEKLHNLLRPLAVAGRASLDPASTGGPWLTNGVVVPYSSTTYSTTVDGGGNAGFNYDLGSGWHVTPTQIATLNGQLNVTTPGTRNPITIPINAATKAVTLPRVGSGPPWTQSIAVLIGTWWFNLAADVHINDTTISVYPQMAGSGTVPNGTAVMLYDSHYTLPTGGIYLVTAEFELQGTNAAGGFGPLLVQSNVAGLPFKDVAWGDWISGSGDTNCHLVTTIMGNAGQELRMTVVDAGGSSGSTPGSRLSNGGAVNHMTVTKLGNF